VLCCSPPLNDRPIGAQIAAIILDGTNLFAGRVGVSGTLILGTLNNGLTLMSVSFFWQGVTHGVGLLIAVGLNQLRVRLQH
jgi:ribose transport system permease protein